MSKLIGEIFMFGVLPAPAFCVEAGGQPLDRVKYADLFRVYGATYGSGDGTTTFNVPDLRGRVPAGPNCLAGDTEPRLAFGDAVGHTGGAQGVTLAAEHIPSLPAAVAPSWGVAGTTGVAGVDATIDTDVANAANRGVSAAAHQNVQPTIIIPFLIWAGV